MFFVSEDFTDASERASHARPSRRQLLVWGLVTASFVAPSPALARRRAASFEAIDRDRDGTIDLDEAKRAAASRFEALDRRHTGKLSHAELGRGRLTVAQFSWADRDHDGTLTRYEYLALVEREFRAVDRDHEGTLSRAEFNARAALPLRRLLH